MATWLHLLAGVNFGIRIKSAMGSSIFEYQAACTAMVPTRQKVAEPQRAQLASAAGNLNHFTLPMAPKRQGMATEIRQKRGPMQAWRENTPPRANSRRLYAGSRY